MHFSTLLPIMPAVLILATWIGFYASLRAVGRTAADSLSIASVSWGVSHWLLAEMLSRTGHLSHGGAVVGWSLATLLTLAMAFILQRRSSEVRPKVAAREPLSTADRLVVGLLVIAVAAIAIVALATPIVAWDAQHYHIPRILYWAQNGSIEHYPTANARQLFMGPWSAFFQLHGYLLAGSDRLAHLLQWLAMLGCLILSAAVARQLGGRRAAAVTAAALVAALPIGILQASTALVDYVAAFWLLVLVFLGFRTVHQDRIGWLDRLALGGALGLAVLTKATVVPIAAPFAVAWLVARLHRRQKSAWATLVVAMLVALTLNAFHMARNQSTFGHVTGPEEHRDLVLNESLLPNLVLSNLVRHNLVHLGTADPEQARIQIALSNSVHQLLGLRDGDPRNSHVGQTLHIEPLRRNENLAGNPAHWLLYLACGLWLIAIRPRHAGSRVWLYGGCLLAAAVIFAAMFKYQQSISRLQLPLFVLTAPWAAVILARCSTKLWPRLVAVLFLLISSPWIFLAEQRPLLGTDSVLRRPRQSFLYQNDGSYRAMAKDVATKSERLELRELGLITHGSSLEYYLWYELSQNESMPQIVNLVPPAGSAPLPDLEPRFKQPPRFAVWLRSPKPAPQSIELHDRSYNQRRYWRWGPHALYRRTPKRP